MVQCYVRRMPVPLEVITVWCIRPGVPLCLPSAIPSARHAARRHQKKKALEAYSVNCSRAKTDNNPYNCMLVRPQSGVEARPRKKRVNGVTSMAEGRTMSMAV